MDGKQHVGPPRDDHAPHAQPAHHCEPPHTDPRFGLDDHHSHAPSPDHVDPETDHIFDEGDPEGANFA